jgi:hypothetical protein
LRDPFDRHSFITFAIQELSRGFNDASAGVLGLALAKE